MHKKCQTLGFENYSEGNEIFFPSPSVRSFRAVPFYLIFLALFYLLKIDFKYIQVWNISFHGQNTGETTEKIRTGKLPFGTPILLT